MSPSATNLAKNAVLEKMSLIQHERIVKYHGFVLESFAIVMEFFDDNFLSRLENSGGPPVFLDLVYQCLDRQPKSRPQFQHIFQALSRDITLLPNLQTKPDPEKISLELTSTAIEFSTIKNTPSAESSSYWKSNASKFDKNNNCHGRKRIAGAVLAALVIVSCILVVVLLTRKSGDNNNNSSGNFSLANSTESQNPERHTAATTTTTTTSAISVLTSTPRDIFLSPTPFAEYPEIKHYEYMGCYLVDSTRTMASAYSFQMQVMTVQQCLSVCMKMGFSMGFITQEVCFCDNNIPESITSNLDTNCTLGCLGDPQQSCGTRKSANVYRSKPATWTRLGCNDTDSKISPTFVQECQYNCQSLGYVYAGIWKTNSSCLCKNSMQVFMEYFQETCKTLSSSLDLFELTQSNGSSWADLGCYDSTTVFENATDMTIQKCLKTCLQSQFAMLTNGNTCSCLNSLPSGYYGNVNEIGCNLPCTGDTSQICGGPSKGRVFVSLLVDGMARQSSTSISTNKLSVMKLWINSGCFSAYRGITKTIVSNNMTIQSCITACLPTCESSGLWAVGVTEVSCLCGVDLTLQVTNIGGGACVPIFTLLAWKWESVGCFTDAINYPSLYHNRRDSFGDVFSQLTVEQCLSICNGDVGGSNGAMGGEYSFAGVESGSTSSFSGVFYTDTLNAQLCTCGQSISSLAVSLPMSNCSDSCLGNSRETCGGGDAGNVEIFSFSLLDPPSTIADNSSRVALCAWIDIGCFFTKTAAVESNWEYTFSMQFDKANSRLSGTWCQSSCQDMGFSLAGVQHGKYFLSSCFCTNGLGIMNGLTLTNSECTSTPTGIEVFEYFCA